MTSKYRACSLGTGAQIILMLYYLLHKTTHLFKGGLEMHGYRATRVLPILGDVEELMNHAARILLNCRALVNPLRAIFFVFLRLPVSEKLLLTGHVHKIPAARWKKNSYLLSPRHSVTGIKALSILSYSF